MVSIEEFILRGSNTVTADNNIIYGSLTGSAGGFSFNNEGILVENSPGCKIQCNTISNTGVGVEFRGGNTSSGDGFFNNTLQFPMRRGLVLSNGGIIGTQGSSSGASANKWTNSASSWPTPNSLDPNKTVIGGPLGGGTASHAASSVLYVHNNLVELPNDNFYNPPSAFVDIYSGPLGSLITTTAVANYTVCPTTLTVGLKMAQSGNSNVTERDADFVNYVNNILPNSNVDMSPQDKFMLKQYMFDELINDPSSDAVLQNFVAQQQNTAIDDYRDIDSLLANGSINAAASKNAQASQNNDITQTQNAYNALYINGINNQSDLDNLTAIADLCPQQHGTAVYQARALLQSITYIGKVYADSCYTNDLVSRNGYDDEAVTSITIADGVIAKLFPNPNNGSFTLDYDLKKNSEATVMIYDISGRRVYMTSIDNINNRTNINTMDLNNGIYFIQLTHDKTLLWTDKLIIQK